jgi:large subunit ribosomal protein L9
MKVILLRDVAKLGKRFAIVETPDGYALNKLIPQGMALPASPENQKRVLARQNMQVANQAEHESSVRAIASALTETGVSVPVDANAQDHLFKAVKASDIVSALLLLGHKVGEEEIVVAEPIKSLGAHQVSLKSGSVAVPLTVHVIRK